MDKHLLKQALIANDLQLDETVIDKLFHYLDLLFRWNKVFNLTAITDYNEAIYLHIIDSLSVIPFITGERIIDVGTGAGLPGIPLALVLPEKKFYLLDSNSKKTRFLQQVVVELGLNNVEVIHSRSEDFNPTQCFDSIVTRAFASLSTMLNVTQHLLCDEGVFIAMKGVYPEKELMEVTDAFQVQSIKRIQLKQYSVERHIVCLQKQSARSSNG